MLKAVIFDLDGVITNSSVYHYQAWKKIADELNIPFDEQYNEKLKGVSRLESLNLILDNGPGRDAFSEDRKKELAERKNDYYRQLIRRITPDDLLPGIHGILEALKKEGILIGLASVSRNAPAIITNLQIAGYFDYMADAERVKNSKPEPDIFIDNLVHLHVDPQDAVGVEDAKAGIEAIHRAGMKAVGVGSRNQMREADLLLDSTADLDIDQIKQLCMQGGELQMIGEN